MRPPADISLDSAHAVFCRCRHVRQKTRESTRKTSTNLENPPKIDLKSTKIAPRDPPRALFPALFRRSPANFANFQGISPFVGLRWPLGTAFPSLRRVPGAISVDFGCPGEPPGPILGAPGSLPGPPDPSGPPFWHTLPAGRLPEYPSCREAARIRRSSPVLPLRVPKGGYGDLPAGV